jgi:hypothetical protein
MSKWLFAALLVLQAHFAASYLVPLDRGGPGGVWRPAEVGLALGNRRRWAPGSNPGLRRIPDLRSLPSWGRSIDVLPCGAGSDGVVGSSSVSGSGPGGIMPMPMLREPSERSSTTTSMVLPFSSWLTTPADAQDLLASVLDDLIVACALARREAERHICGFLVIGQWVQAQHRSLCGV